MIIFYIFFKVPLLAKICPKDLITVYKKGSKFRVDFHVTGLDRRSIPKFLKGNMSVIVNLLPNEGNNQFINFIIYNYNNI